MKCANICHASRMAQLYIAGLVVFVAFSARAATVTWLPASGTNDWFVGANWTGGNFPTNGDDVLITNNNVGVLLTNSTASLSSILLSNNCSLVFSNWNTSLTATNVLIMTNAVMTLPAAFTNNAMSNRVWIICSNLTIAPGGSINVDGKGYARGTNGQQASGPGYGYSGGEAGSGAGYGGAGARGYYGYPGGTYGSTNAPLSPGSGGGGYTVYGGGNGTDGGGAVRIEAAGAVTINGTISASAPSVGHRMGGGSGGAVYITCNTFAGTNGIIRANGAAYSGGGSYWATGGGGRIAVVYNQAAQASLPKPRVRFSADRGMSGYYGQADIGSIYFTDWTVMDYDWMAHTGVLGLSNFTSWSVSSLLVTNGYIRIPSASPFALTVTNDLNIVGPNGIFWVLNGAITCGGNIAISGSGSALYLGTASALTNVQTLSCAGNVTLSTNTSLYVYSALTNAAQTNYGALVDVAGDVSIATGAWIYAYSHNTNGGSPLFRVRNLTIAAGGGINANGAGWRGGIQNWGLGPGKGGYSSQTGGGGGYGGGGGTSGVGTVGGGTYGSSNAPLQPGSGGGGLSGNPNAQGGAGGGLVRLEATNTITVNGAVTANGGPVGQGGGGSGGGIYLKCQRFAGSSNGLLSADGGPGFWNYTGSGGGGGGRIAVWRPAKRHFYQGSYSVLGGTNSGGGGANGTNGTFFLGDVPSPTGTFFGIY